MRFIFLGLFIVNFLAMSSVYSAPVRVQTDIFYEIAKGNKKAIRSWLKTKPNLSLCNDNGQSLLTVAAVSGHRAIVKMLMKAGALINSVDQAGKTVLDYAVEYSQFKIVCDLVKKGGKVMKADNLYRVKSILKNRAFSLIVQFAALWLFGGLVFGALAGVAVTVALPVVAICLTVGLCALAISPVVIGAYTLALPFRALSWHSDSERNWMLDGTTCLANV